MGSHYWTHGQRVIFAGTAENRDRNSRLAMAGAETTGRSGAQTRRPRDHTFRIFN
jgi:hypothetical protein